MKVMIIDDEPEVRALAGLALRCMGRMDVIALSDGTNAVETASAEAPDCILLDAMTPGLNGQETLERLRADSATAGIPVIFLTRRKADADAESLKRLGARTVLAKPFRPSVLVESVRSAVGVGS